MLPNWSRVEIGGKPAEVFIPIGEPPRFGLLFLHPVGLESISDNVAYTAELAKHRLACCVPFGQRSWWTDRLCTEFDAERTAEQHLLQFVWPWMQATWALRSNATAVAGVSMGGQGALRLGYKYPTRFPVVGSVAGALEYEQLYGAGSPLDEMYRSREAARQDTAILHIQPHAYPAHIWFACDPADELWYRGNDRLAEKLSAMGIPHTADLTTSAGGHSWQYFNGMAAPLLAFLADALRKQGRRLPGATLTSPAAC